MDTSYMKILPSELRHELNKFIFYENRQIVADVYSDCYSLLPFIDLNKLFNCNMLRSKINVNMVRNTYSGTLILDDNDVFTNEFIDLYCSQLIYLINESDHNANVWNIIGYLNNVLQKYHYHKRFIPYITNRSNVGSEKYDTNLENIS